MKQNQNRMPLVETSTAQMIDENEQLYPKKKFSSARVHMRRWFPFVCVIVFGALLRFWGLGDKPLHHDESLHAYFSLQLMHQMENWRGCFEQQMACYHYDPLLHGPFQFHIIALVYKISQLLGAPDHGVNTTSLRIAAATLGSAMVSLPYFLRDYLGGRRNALVACFLLAISPSLVYYSRFAREDIYMAFFTLLLIVAAGLYVRSRKGRWCIIGTVAFVLSYATKEATFLSVAVFGSFLSAIIAWELGVKIPVRKRIHSRSLLLHIAPKTAAPLGVVALLLLCAPLIKWFFGWMKDTAAYINLDTPAADVVVKNLKAQTMTLLPWLGLLVGLCALLCWRRERLRQASALEQHRLANRIDPVRQPILMTIVTMPWTHWLSSLLIGASIFVVLFSVLFTNLATGIGDGIWQGLYYWLQQQQVARGGQPWYYYLLLLPLYEQLGVVFSIVGIVRCVQRPTRFRLFLVYWFLGTLAIYSWAGEKMPWLVIHIALPMMLLATIGLEPVTEVITMVVKKLQRDVKNDKNRIQSVECMKPKRSAIFGAFVALFLLILTLQNMFQVTYVHYADGPQEMMIYVQSTADVTTVMDKIDLLDQKIYRGKHLLNIGVVADASWPFYWYLRDYTNVCYGFPTGCADANPEVIVTGGDKSQDQPVTSTSTGKASDYLFHQYALRSWWDEGYKPPPCVASTTISCQGQPTWGGVGPLLWLSYGDTPVAGAQFDPGLAARNVWDWWWFRKPFGSTNGATGMGLFIRSDLGVNP
jgi:uncharacterized protein (TIGR03663 family)